MAPTHDCPGGCGRQVAQQYFACRTCWFRLPLDLRSAIQVTYKVDPDAHGEAMVDAMEWYAALARVTR